MFDVASARDVPFGIPQYTKCIPHALTSVLLCVQFIFADIQLTLKCVDLVVAHDGLLCMRNAEIVRIVHSGYLDYRGAFRLGLDSYSCVTSRELLKKKCKMDTSLFRG